LIFHNSIFSKIGVSGKLGAVHMVLGRFSFAAFCLLLSFSLLNQRPIVAFVEAAVNLRSATRNGGEE
jgi:hypothetical protein